MYEVTYQYEEITREYKFESPLDAEAKVWDLQDLCFDYIEYKANGHVIQRID